MLFRRLSFHVLSIALIAAPAAFGKEPALTAEKRPPVPVDMRPRPYPAEYQVLQKRCIFANGGQARADAEKAAAVQGTLALRGIAQEDASFTAIIEDTTNKRTLQLRRGDLIGSARVAAITLHTVDLETGGAVAHVEIGQALGPSGGTIAEAPVASAAPMLDLSAAPSIPVSTSASAAPQNQAVAQAVPFPASTAQANAAARREEKQARKRQKDAIRIGSTGMEEVAR